MKIRMLAALVLLLTSASIFAQDPNVPNDVTVAKITDAAEPATNGIVRFTFAQAKVSVCTINYNVTGDTGEVTFDPSATSIDMPSNSTTVDLQVVPIDNNVVNGSRSVTLTVTSITGCPSVSLGAPISAIVNIADNDASLTVIKHVVNDNGGTAVASNWTMDVTANNPSNNNFPGAESPGTSIVITTGAFSVAESGGPGGYIATPSGDCSGTAVGGSSYTCTITNDDLPASLTVIKHVVNDGGGSNVASDWLMNVTEAGGNQSFPGAESPGITISIDAGGYNVDESAGPAGYSKSLGADCSGTAVNGGSYSCTITNTFVPATTTTTTAATTTTTTAATTTTTTAAPTTTTTAATTTTTTAAPTTTTTAATTTTTTAAPTTTTTAGSTTTTTAGPTTTTTAVATTTTTTTSAPTTTTTLPPFTPALTLDKTADRLSYTSLGEVINYTYLVTSSGTGPVAGPITVADDKVAVTCPNVNTVGNNDANLDPAEAISCTATYVVVQADLLEPFIRNTATASGDAGATNSNIDQVTVLRVGGTVISGSLKITPDVASYGTVGEIIHYTYEITNTSQLVVAGPIVVDSDISTDEVCPAVNTVGNNDDNLDPDEVIVCTSTYTVVQADIDNGSITNTATASGDGGQVTTNTVLSTVTAAGVPPVTDDNVAIPTLTEWAMALLAFLFLMVAMTYLRRKQTA